VSGLTYRALGWNHPIGKHVITLPREWVRFVEFTHISKLRAVEMTQSFISVNGQRDQAKLSIKPAYGKDVSSQLGGELMSRRELKRIRRAGPFSSSSKDDRGPVSLAHVYCLKSGVRLVALPEVVVRWWMRGADKKLYRVAVLAFDDRLEVLPDFYNLPRRAMIRKG
jgi:hypothetical protein